MQLRSKKSIQRKWMFLISLFLTASTNFLLVGLTRADVPVPIGRTEQTTLFESNPTSHMINGFGDLTGMESAYDGNLDTEFHFKYGFGDGYFELCAFTVPSDSGKTNFNIGWVDFKISYRASGTSISDEKYRIIYYVGTAGPVVLQDWVSSNAAKLDYGGAQAQRAWSNQPEPNDGIWDWTDIINLRIRIETDKVTSDHSQLIFLYEVWLTVYPTPFPTVGLSVQPTTIRGINAGGIFFIDVYAVSMTNLFSYEFLLNYDTNVLSALDINLGHEFFSYYPFDTVYASDIEDDPWSNGTGYIHLGFHARVGDPNGFTGSTPLARIYFQVDAVGESALDLHDALLFDPFGNTLVHDEVDGSFDNRPPQTPEASFSWTPSAPMEREIVTFDASTSTPNGGTIISYAWSFGDDTPNVIENAPVTTHTYLSGCLQPFTVTLNVTDSEGYFDLEAKAIIIKKHDVAIDSIAVDENRMVEIGTVVNIQMRVSNEGHFPETFNVTAFYNNTAFGQEIVVGLASAASENLNFQWDTIAFPGTYIIKAVANSVAGENDIADNTKINGNVTIQGVYQFSAPDFSKSPVPSYYDTSEYMLGNVAVGIILPESIGGAYNWTQSEINQTVTGIMNATEWWKSQNPYAHLRFSFDVHVQVPTSCEPIEMPIWEDFTWIDEVMSNLDYTSGSAWDKVIAYNNDIRSALGTDWAFTIFVADSDYRINQGLFGGATGYAHAFLGGPWITMSRLSSWAWNARNYLVAVPAHEMGHIFYATDEYNYAREHSGYLNASDNDGAYGIMNENSLFVSTSTKLQIGWRDLDHDDIMDIMDTYPAIDCVHYPNKIYQRSYTFKGAVVDVPYLNCNPFGRRNNITINHIVSVDYSIDGGAWISAKPSDGTFDEALENYTFTATFPTSGTHLLRIRAANSVGNFHEETFPIEILQPTIVVNPISGPVGTSVKVEGVNFEPEMLGYITFDDQFMGYVPVDKDGRFNATLNIPLCQVGQHTIKLLAASSRYLQGVIATAIFTVVDTTPLNVTVDAGPLYFKQETAEFYVLTTFKGVPVNVSSINATLYKPDGKTENLTLKKIITGFYKIQYLIAGRGSMVGTYTLLVEARYTNETVLSDGTAIKAFLVKPTWEQEWPKMAGFSIASIGLVSAMILLWRKEKKKFI